VFTSSFTVTVNKGCLSNYVGLITSLPDEGGDINVVAGQAAATTFTLYFAKADTSFDAECSTNDLNVHHAT
jgi:hypothetical protein